MAAYTAIATLNRTAPPDDALVDEVITTLRNVGGILTADEWQRLQILCTVEADNMNNAMITAGLWLSPWSDQVKVEILDEAEFEAWAHPRDYATVTEAAAELGVSRQSVLQRIRRGTLPARRRGHRWAVPWSALTTTATPQR